MARPLPPDLARHDPSGLDGGGGSPGAGRRRPVDRIRADRRVDRAGARLLLPACRPGAAVAIRPGVSLDLERRPPTTARPATRGPGWCDEPRRAFRAALIAGSRRGLVAGGSLPVHRRRSLDRRRHRGRLIADRGWPLRSWAVLVRSRRSRAPARSCPRSRARSRARSPAAAQPRPRPRRTRSAR